MKFGTALTAFLAVTTIADGFSTSSPLFGMRLRRNRGTVKASMEEEAYKQAAAANDNMKKAEQALQELENAARSYAKKPNDGEGGVLNDPSTEIKTAAVMADARLTDYKTEEETVVAKNEDELVVTKTAVETATFEPSSDDVDVLARAMPDINSSKKRAADLISEAEKASKEAKIVAEQTLAVDSKTATLKEEGNTLLAAKKKAEDAVVQAEKQAAALAAAIEQAKQDAARLAAEEADAKNLADDVAAEKLRVAKLAAAESKQKVELLKQAERQEKIRAQAEGEADAASKLADDKGKAEQMARKRAADLLAEEEGIRARIAELERMRQEAEAMAAEEAKLKTQFLEKADDKRGEALLAEGDADAAKEAAKAKETIEINARARADKLTADEKDLRDQIAKFAEMRKQEAAKVSAETKRLAAAEKAADAKEIELARIALEAASKAEETARLQEEKRLLEVKMVEEKVREANLIADAKTEQERRIALERNAYDADIKSKAEQAAHLKEDAAVVEGLISDEQRRMMEKIEEMRSKVEQMEASKAKIEGTIKNEKSKKAELADLTARIAEERKLAEEAAASIRAKAAELSKHTSVDFPTGTATARVDVESTAIATATDVDVDVKVETETSIDGEVVSDTTTEKGFKGLLKKIF